MRRSRLGTCVLLGALALAPACGSDDAQDPAGGGATSGSAGASTGGSAGGTGGSAGGTGGSAGGTGGSAGSTGGSGGSAGVPELPLLDSVAQFGITWRFEAPVPVGRFVNGDYYVVGPTRVVEITPAPAAGRNGSVINLPAEQDRTGFDDRTEANRFDASLRSDPPFTLAPGDSLVSSISVATTGQIPCMLRPEDSSSSPVQTAAILTALDQAVAEDAFRPPYTGGAAKLYYASSLGRSRLPSHPRPAATPPLADFERVFERPWIDNLFFQFDAPAENMPCYGREIARAVSNASLLLMVDYPIADRETLLVRFVQYGLDLWGLVKAGYPGWQAHGGHGNGRKWPILFAGILLDDPEIKALATDHPEVLFSEDMQTIGGTGWTGATALYGGHVGANGESVNPGWGPYEHLQPSGWLGDSIGESYRRCCTSIGWIGEALAARLLAAQPLWAHDAFFDYADRWMTEDDATAVQAILQQTGQDYSASWARQGQAWDAFVDQMWAAHR